MGLVRVPLRFPGCNVCVVADTRVFSAGVSSLPLNRCPAPPPHTQVGSRVFTLSSQGELYGWPTETGRTEGFGRATLAALHAGLGVYAKGRAVRIAAGTWNVNETRPRCVSRLCAAMQKLRIVMLRFGTGRQTDGQILELSRRSCTCEYGVHSCRGESAGVAKRPRERSPTRNPTRYEIRNCFIASLYPLGARPGKAPFGMTHTTLPLQRPAVPRLPRRLMGVPPLSPPQEGRVQSVAGWVCATRGPRVLRAAGDGDGHGVRPVRRGQGNLRKRRAGNPEPALAAARLR